MRHFIVENLRSARRFLKRCDRSIDIDSLTFDVLDEHTRPSEVAAMLAPMERGEDMAIVSEAGCPAVADPGSDAVAEAQRRGYRVCPLVEPSVFCSPLWLQDSTARLLHSQATCR